MRLYIPLNRLDQSAREAETRLREAAGGTPYLQGHTWEVGEVASLREARDVLARTLPVVWPLHGAALLPD